MTVTVEWVAEELRFTDLGDTRRNRRLVCIEQWQWDTVSVRFQLLSS